MSVAVLIRIVGWDGLAPSRTTLEVDVFDVGSSVNYINVNAFATVGGVEVLVEGAKGEAVTVRNTG